MQQLADRLTLSSSDATAYLACEHLTSLSLAVARGELATPPFDNDQAELLFRKGREHEEVYLARLEEPGRHVLKIELEPDLKIELEPDLDWERASRETVDTMRAGADVVYALAAPPAMAYGMRPSDRRIPCVREGPLCRTRTP